MLLSQILFIVFIKHNASNNDLLLDKVFLLLFILIKLL